MLRCTMAGPNPTLLACLVLLCVGIYPAIAFFRVERQVSPVECGKTPKKCVKWYGGTCKPFCDIGELAPISCKDGCKCCGCEDNGCRLRGGICMFQKFKCNGRKIGKYCRGKRCFCCFPEPTTSTTTTTTTSPFECHPTRCCSLLGGRCTDAACHDNELEEPQACELGCRCCVGNPCLYSQICNFRGGKCKEECGDGETADADLCEGDNCKCCIPDCDQTKCCRAAGGRCDESCQPWEVVDDTLCQAGCSCCLGNSTTQVTTTTPVVNVTQTIPPANCSASRCCEAIGGRCVKDCTAGKVDNLCNEPDCTCCVEKPVCILDDRCTQRGGMCQPDCGTGVLIEDPDIKLCPDCKCCAPASTTSVCDESECCKAMGGKCSMQQCGPTFRSVPGVCTNGCFCCVPEP